MESEAQRRQLLNEEMRRLTQALTYAQMGGSWKTYLWRLERGLSVGEGPVLS